MNNDNTGYCTRNTLTLNTGVNLSVFIEVLNITGNAVGFMEVRRLDM